MKTKDRIRVEKNKINTFHSWVENNYTQITNELLEAAADFLSQYSEQPISASDLKFDNRWHYIDKTKKQGYIGELNKDRNHVPVLTLTHKTFKHGGETNAFKSYDVIKVLWQEEKQGRGLKYRPILVPKKIKPSTKTVQKSTVNDDLQLWDNLKVVGANPYLKRKKLAQSQEIKGIRFSDRFIAVRVIDSNSNPCGIQKIYADGSKRFSKGLSKKGNFSLIGANKLPQKPERILITEGVATAASIHLATLEPVFAAMDAGNLLPVAKKLKQKYPRTEMVFWADNDCYKAEKLNPNGEKIGNTGLISANHAAIKVRKAKVVYPDFTQISDWNGVVEPKDFNDLHQISGLEALLKVKPQKPDLELGLNRELKKAKKRLHGILSAKQFEKGSKEVFNDRYLPSSLEIKPGVNLIRSPIGTGKTHAIKELIKAKPELSIMFTTHLISLVENGAGRLGLCSYNQCDNFDLQMERRLSICLNSIGKLAAEGPVPQYDVLVIDEVEQVLTRLTNELDNKPLIFKVLEKLIENATYVVCLDAHLSKATVELLKSWVGHKPFQVVINEYQVGQDKSIVLYEDKESLQAVALQALESNQNLYLTFNSKTEAQKVSELFKQTMPTKKGLYISGDNSGDKETIAFFSDVNKAAKEYDYVICSPSISTGVSINIEHFDFVAGFFNTGINTANDCMQALGRVRNAKTTHVFCETRRGFKPLDPNIISSKWNETHKHDLGLMNLTEDGERILINNEYEQLAIVTTQNRNRSHNNFYEEFALLVLEDGYSFKYADFCLEKEDKKFLRDMKKQCIEHARNEYSEDIKNLTEVDIKRLEKKTRKTLEETLSYERHKLAKFYRLMPHEHEQLGELSRIDNQGRLRKKILSLELALSDKGKAKALFEKQYEDSPKFAADLNHYATEQLLFKEVIKEIGVDWDGNTLVSLKKTYTKESLLEGKLIPWIKKNYRVLCGVISLPPMDNLEKEPIRLMSKLLDKLGLKQKRIGKSENGVYTLDEERLELIKSIVIKRSAISGNSSSNICIYKAGSVSERIKIPSKSSQSANTAGLILDKAKSILLSGVGKLSRFKDSIAKTGYFDPNCQCSP